MMPAFVRTCCFALILSWASLASAQLLEIDQYKTIFYQQNGAAQVAVPRTPNVYEFFTYIYTDPAITPEYSPLFVGDDSTNMPVFYPVENGNFNSFFSSWYTNGTDFDTDYPNGTFQYVANYFIDDQPNSDNVFVQTPATNLYSTTIPLVSSSSWNAMQQVDPTLPLSVSWNGYSLTPGADYATTIVYVYDSQSYGSYGGYDEFIDPTVTSTVIPAGSLDYGRSYILALYFSNRASPSVTNESGSSVTTTVGYDVVTDINLITIPPPLRITQTATQTAALTWPQAATNYILQGTGNLACSGCWTNITDSPSTDGQTNSLTVSIGGQSQFFRLAPLSQ